MEGFFEYGNELQRPLNVGNAFDYLGKYQILKNDPAPWSYVLYFQEVTAVRRPGREVNYIPTSSVDVKNEWSHTASPSICLYDVYESNVKGTSKDMSSHNLTL